jgi:hypothetical protein
VRQQQRPLSLSMRYTRVSGEVYELLADLIRGCGQLIALDLRDCWQLVDGAQRSVDYCEPLLTAISTCSTLETLILGDVLQNDASKEVLFSALQSNTLRPQKLHLTRVEFTWRDAVHLFEALQRNSSLVEFVYSNRCTSTRSPQPSTPDLGEAISMFLRNDEGGSSTSTLKILNLDLRGCGPQTSTLKAILHTLAASPTNTSTVLRELTFEGDNLKCLLDADTMLAVAELLRSNGTLQKLHLHRCWVTVMGDGRHSAAAMKALCASIRKNTTLTTLRLHLVDSRHVVPNLFEFGTNFFRGPWNTVMPDLLNALKANTVLREWPVHCFDSTNISEDSRKEIRAIMQRNSLMQIRADLQQWATDRS